jgi:hypothetical protein
MPLPMPSPAGGAPAAPALATAKPNLGGPTAPQGNAGNAMAGLGKIKVALQALQDALPSIPMGSPLHTDVLSVAKTLSKHVDQEGQQGGPPVQSMLQMIQQMKQNAPNAALARMGGGAPQSPAMLPAAGGAPPA